VGYRPTNVRYVVLFGLCLAAGLAYVHRGCLSIVESTIRHDRGITEREMEWATAAFYLAYAIFQIPTGVLADRWGPRRALVLFGLLGASTMALSSATRLGDAATGFAILFVSRLLMGLAQAGLFPASTRALAVWIPLKRRSFVTGTLQACMSVGGAVGAFVTARLFGVLSWEWVFAIYAVPGLAWSAWFFIWFRDRPADHRSVNQSERDLLQSEVPLSAAPQIHWLAVFVSLPVVLLCAQQFFRAGANVFWLTWCPTFLQDADVFALDKQTAGELTSIPILGVVFGSIMGGTIADRVFVRSQSRRMSRGGTAIVATFLGALCFFAAYPAATFGLVWGMIVLTAAAFIVSCGNSCGYSAAMDLGGRNLASVFGAMNMFGNFGAFAFSVVGREWAGWFGWKAIVLLVGGSYLLGCLCWLPLNPNPKTPPSS
jgi:MFS transporter, ACS family, D-galactonate transporter